MKKNYFGTDVPQTQDTIENFSNKIKAGKAAQVTDDFMIISRISFILNKDLEDALERAYAYVEAGADGVMIHSKNTSGDDIKSFCLAFRKTTKYTNSSSPSSYNQIEDEFISWGANIVIYANHLLRASYPAMLDVAKSILENKRSLEASDNCMSIKEILELIPGTK